MWETVRVIKVPWSKGRGGGVGTLSSVTLKTKHAKSFGQYFLLRYLVFFHTVPPILFMFILTFYVSVK